MLQLLGTLPHGLCRTVYDIQVCYVLIEWLYMKAGVGAPVNNRLALLKELHFDLGGVSGVWCVRNASPACTPSQLQAGHTCVPVYQMSLINQC